MKLIYVAHPYGGKKENEVAADVITRMLQKRFPEQCFVSPIHGIREIDIYDENTTEDEYLAGMRRCITLLSRCDAIVLTGDWKKSRGCCLEFFIAQCKGIPVLELEKLVAMDKVAFHLFLGENVAFADMLHSCKK